MKDLDDKLTDDDKKDLNEALDKLKEANNSNNVADIQEAMDNLNSIWNTKASTMYNSSKGSADAASQPDSSDDTSKGKSEKKIDDADIQDAEVVEED